MVETGMIDGEAGRQDGRKGLWPFHRPSAGTFNVSPM